MTACYRFEIAKKKKKQLLTSSSSAAAVLAVVRDRAVVFHQSHAFNAQGIWLILNGF